MTYLLTGRLQQLCAGALRLGSREFWGSVLLSETNQKAKWREQAEAKGMAFLNQAACSMDINIITY